MSFQSEARQTFESLLPEVAAWKLAKLLPSPKLPNIVGELTMEPIAVAQARAMIKGGVCRGRASDEIFAMCIEGGAADIAASVALSLEAYPAFVSALEANQLSPSAVSRLEDAYIKDAVRGLSQEQAKTFKIALPGATRPVGIGI